MSTPFALLLLAAMSLLMPGLMAQNLSAPADEAAEHQAEDPIESAIRAFNNRDRSKPNEVTVVLEPAAPETPDKDPEEAPAEDAATTPAPEAAADADSEAPKVVLVTGKPPKGSQVIQLSDIPVADSPEASLAAEEISTKPRQGLELRVETVQSGSGEIDTKHINLLAPFPAKPLIPPPAGWQLKVSEEAPPFTREVELAPGKTITLSIQPHLLVPDANGTDVFAVPEPGFNASLGFDQSDTVAIALKSSIQKLEEDSKQLGLVIDRLQQLMVSLPQSENPPGKPSPNPARPKP